MEKAYINGKMAVNMMENGLKTRYKDGELIHGKMVESTKGNG